MSLFNQNQCEQVTVGINQSAIAHIIERLTDLYPFPIQATVRETVSNAIDATKAAVRNGSKVKPIEVNTPNPYHLKFVVKDFGTGMSPETVRTVFAQYGGTTKGADASQIGSFGLGAKAPLAYSDTFYIETTCSGVTTKATMSRNANGVDFQMETFASENTCNGTTITIPVKDNMYEIEQFNQALNSYRYLSFDIPIVINGETYYGNDDYIELGSIVIEQSRGITGRVWVRHDALPALVKSAFLETKFISWTFAYLLSGFLYTSPSVTNSRFELPKSGYGLDKEKYADVIIELKPKVVEFTSSRDHITNNQAAATLDALVQKSLQGHDTFLADSVIKKFYQLKNDSARLEILRSMNPQWNCDNIVFTTVHGSQTEVELSQFDDDNGHNILRDIVRFNNPSVFATVTFDERNSIHLFMNVSNTASNALFSAVASLIPYNNVCDLTEAIRNRFVSPSKRYTLLDSTEALKVSSSARNGVKTIYVVQNIKTEKDLSRVIRCRKTLTRMHSKFSFILASDSIPVEEQGVFNQQFDSSEKVVFSDVEHIVKLVKSNRAANSENIVPEDNQVSLYSYGESDKTIDELLEFSGRCHRNKRPVNVSDLVEQNAIVILTKYPNKGAYQRTLLGYHQKYGDAAFNRPVYMGCMLLKTDLEQLIAAGVELLVDVEFTHTSGVGKNLIKNRSFHLSVTEYKLSHVTEEKIEAIYLISKLPSYGASIKWMKNALDYGSVKHPVIQETYDWLTNVRDVFQSTSGLPCVDTEYYNKHVREERRELNRLFLERCSLNDAKYWKTNEPHQIACSMLVQAEAFKETPKFLDEAITVIADWMESL